MAARKTKNAADYSRLGPPIADLPQAPTKAQLQEVSELSPAQLATFHLLMRGRDVSSQNLRDALEMARTGEPEPEYFTPKRFHAHAAPQSSLSERQWR